MTDAILQAAEHLATGRRRYLEGHALGAVCTKFRLNHDDGRRACIVADRIRRQRQLAEGRNTFREDGLVEPGAPIVLQIEPKAKRRRQGG